MPFGHNLTRKWFALPVPLIPMDYFRVMTTTRPEIIIEGSLDGKTWRPYEFGWKPTNPSQSARFAGPHMPRIDWQMWFEGLNYERFNHPFSLLLYHKFLHTIALGGSIEDFNDFGKMIGAQEYQNFIQASPTIRQQILANYNSPQCLPFPLPVVWKIPRSHIGKSTCYYETIG